MRKWLKVLDVRSSSLAEFTLHGEGRSVNGSILTWDSAKKNKTSFPCLNLTGDLTTSLFQSIKTACVSATVVYLYWWPRNSTE